MMHKLTAVRRAAQEARLRHEGKPFLRPILSGTARASMTPSDIEAREAVAIPVHNADGSFVFLDGYDNIDDYL
jgi:hypothetical protein